MFCHYCGKTIPDNSMFCHYCGKGVSNQIISSKPAVRSKPSKYQCSACGATITDTKSRFCPKCLVQINWATIKPMEMSKKNSETDSEIIIEFYGSNGQIDLYNDKLIIKRAGFIAVLSHGFTKGDKTIYLNQITGIQFKEAGLLVGYIQFTLPGGIESRRGIMDAAKDENTVTFEAFRNDDARKLKERIEELVQKMRRSTSQAVHISSADEIRKFKQLHDEGIISKDEFEKKKKELLG